MTDHRRHQTLLLVVLCSVVGCQRERAGAVHDDVRSIDTGVDPFEVERARVAAYASSPDVASALRSCVTSDTDLTIEIDGEVVTLPDFPSCVMPPMYGFTADTVVHVPIRIRAR